MEASLNSPLGRINLTSTVLTIGRSPGNQLALPDQQASSHHAEIRPDAQGYLLGDLNSTNGTFVNEQRLAPQSPRLLTNSDVIRIGTTTLTYEIAGSYDATARADAGEYANPGYAPTMAAPPSYSSPSYPEYPPAYPPPYAPPPAYPDYPPQAYPQPTVYSPPQAAYPQSPDYPPQAYPQQQPWPGAPAQAGMPDVAVAQPKKRNNILIIGI